MPIVKPEDLEELTGRIFAARGVPREDADWIATLLVRANLRGHDSHGVIRIAQYVASMEKGMTNATPKIRVRNETPTTAVLDGDQGFGQVVARRGMELAIDKARAQGLAAVALANTNHVGRLADYVELAAREGMIGLMWVNAPLAPGVAPWGGAARRLATNPHAVGVPGRGGAAMLLDFATSVVAEGKMRVKFNRREQAPPGWMLDGQGHPSTDPQKYYATPRGSLLPMGEHKGYGLALAVEILAGILSGTGAASDKVGPVRNGTLMVVIDVRRFLPLAAFHQQVEALFGWVKSAPLVENSKGILIPGEPETQTEADRRANGIYIEDETWAQIQAAERGSARPSPFQV
jgi:hydroxycarboxylate dehydrogenase B